MISDGGAVFFKLFCSCAFCPGLIVLPICLHSTLTILTFLFLSTRNKSQRETAQQTWPFLVFTVSDFHRKVSNTRLFFCGKILSAQPVPGAANGFATGLGELGRLNTFCMQVFYK